MCTGVKSTTSVDIDRKVACVAYYEQVINNVVASFVDKLFIVGSTPVNINRETKLLISQFLHVYRCAFLLQIQKSSHFKDYLESMTSFFYIILYSIYHIGCRRSR